ncbi:MAG: AIPR family protein [Candidatus Krumholzibacteriia bacterium]
MSGRGGAWGGSWVGGRVAGGEGEVPRIQTTLVQNSLNGPLVDCKRRKQMAKWLLRRENTQTLEAGAMSFVKTFVELKNYLDEIVCSIGDIDSRSKAFIYWFAQAVITNPDNRVEILNALVEGPADKNCDIVYICDQTRMIYICQMKWHDKLEKNTEKYNDLAGLAEVVNSFRLNKADFRKRYNKANSGVRSLLFAAHQKFHAQKNDYRITGIFVTTGRVAEGVAKDAEKHATADQMVGRCRYLVFSGKECCKVHQAFSNLVPSLPEVEVGVKGGGELNHSEKTSKKFGRNISTYLYSVQISEIRRLFEMYGERLFARNIRLYKGEKTPTNLRIAHTLTNNPEKFFHLNNGITIIGTHAMEKSERGAKKIVIQAPQIINGQQTTRTIGRCGARGSRAEVLIRVVSMEIRSDGDLDFFQQFVRDIVQATNDQNSIKASELVANNREQIDIYRQLRKLGWNYLRKSGTQQEGNRETASLIDGRFRPYGSIKMMELCAAMIACYRDPQYMATGGAERIFSPTGQSIYDEIFQGRHDAYDYLISYLLLRACSSFRKRSGKTGLDSELCGIGKYYFANTIFQYTKRHTRTIQNKRIVAERLGLESRKNPANMDFGAFDRAVSEVHASWKKFYKTNKLNDESPKDFVKRFAKIGIWSKFWDHPNNTLRKKRVMVQIDRFISK